MAFYGIPIENKYPLNTEEEVNVAILQFNKCPVIKRKILADNINKRILELDMLITLQEDNDFINYIDKRHLVDVRNNDIRSCYKNCCDEITQISTDNKNAEEYNKEVYNSMVKFIESNNNIEKVTDFLRHGNDYADGVTKNLYIGNNEALISMDIVHQLCESLYLISLQYNVSKDYVSNLLDDLEELYVEFQDKYIIKRKILALNQYNTRCVQIKTELNVLIGKRTKDLLNGKVSFKSVGKMTRLMLKADKADGVLSHYLKDKQSELKEYLTMQSKYFLSGFDFKKSCLTGLNCDQYSMMEAEIDIQNSKHEITMLTNKYPQLILDITYSDMYRLHKKLNYVKQIPVNGLANITIASMNNGQIYVVTKKKKNPNVFYLVNYDELLKYTLVSETGISDRKSIKGIKLIFKNEVLDDNIDLALESCTRF